MTTSTADLEKRLAQLKRAVPTRGLERHVTLLKNISDLPAELRSPAVAALADGENLQAIVDFPPQIHRGWEYVPKQALLFTSTGVIHLLASIWPAQEPEVTCLEGRGLMYMKATLLLLYGYLEIVAQGRASPTRLGLEFNTVAWDNLSPYLRQVLQAAKASPGAPADKTTYSPAARRIFEKLPLKFSNGVKLHGLLPGEGLEDLVFQPGAWKRWLLIFRKPVSANILLLLTSNYVAVIEEELGIEQGWIISYIPRNNIIGMQNRPRGRVSDITVRLKRGDQTADYELQLKNETARAWRSAWIQHGGLWQDLAEETGK
jgi:hypothetical protein